VARCSAPRFPPLGRWEAVPATWTRDRLREAFAHWGLPRQIRVDNGTPWGSTGGLPTDLALWLIALGVTMIWNDPRCPQQNGVIERSQGTGKRWAEPSSCRDRNELQSRVDEMDRIQRERYPALGGRTRLEVSPGLTHSGRTYQPGDEASLMHLDRVFQHLSGYVGVRRADAGGTISLYNRSRYISRMLAGRDVYVSFDRTERRWVFADEKGVEYRRQDADEFTPERIMNLDVSRHRDRPDKRKRHNTPPEFPAQRSVG
jgi:hypothetical protein